MLVTNLTIANGEGPSAVTVQAETSTGATYSMPVEYVGEVPNFEWLTQIVVKVPDDLAHAGAVHVKINHGSTSNKASLTIN